MKFTPEVVAALAVLRDAAENDFERHRIDVLERDLTSPPVAEQVDEKTQVFDGVAFRQCKSGHHSVNYQIHRAIWQYYFGKIPRGYEIHHIDNNPTNNSVENLQRLTISEHRQIHHISGVKTSMKSFVCAQCGKSFVALDHGNNRFCSHDCRIKFHHKKCEKTRVCPQCGKTFSTRNKNQVGCSRSCAAKLAHQRLKQQNQSSAGLLLASSLPAVVDGGSG